MTKSYLEIAKEQGAVTPKTTGTYGVPTSKIVFENEAQLIATVNAIMAQESEPVEVVLNIQHKDCHKAADAFWQYWRENGATHKHGYYESTWGAINQALRYVGVKPSPVNRKDR